MERGSFPGIAIEEALGLRGERWLHDHKLSRLTLDLRRQFPVMNAVGPEDIDGTTRPGDAGVLVFDGVRFISGYLSQFSADDQQKLQPLKATLAEELYALSDLVMAEAAHQRSMGSPSTNSRSSPTTKILLSCFNARNKSPKS